jgi:hypothetical protein
MSLSFSVDWPTIFDQASSIINGLFPVYMVPLGIMLGLGLLGYIVKAFKGAISRTG